MQFWMKLWVAKIYQTLHTYLWSIWTITSWCVLERFYLRDSSCRSNYFCDALLLINWLFVRNAIITSTRTIRAGDLTLSFTYGLYFTIFAMGRWNRKRNSFRFQLSMSHYALHFEYVKLLLLADVCKPFTNALYNASTKRTNR